ALLLAGGKVLHGRALAERGEDGLGPMRQGLADWQATGAVSHRPYQLALLAEVLGREGRGSGELAAVAGAPGTCAGAGEVYWGPGCPPPAGGDAAGAGQGRTPRAGRGGSRFSPGPGGGPPTGGPVAGVAGRGQPEPPVPAARPAGGSPAAAGGELRRVHR